jgi:hypothetical protein
LRSTIALKALTFDGLLQRVAGRFGRHVHFQKSG